MADFNYSLGFDIPSENTVNPTYKYKGGFPAGYQLPAPHFNWIINKTSRAIDELQKKKFDLGGVYSDDMNELVSSGQYRLHNNTNLPPNSYYGQAFVGRGAIGADTVVQIVVSYSGHKMYYRGGRCQNDKWIWEEWSEIYSTNNNPYAQNLNGVLPIPKGGTGATDRKTAFSNLAFLGTAPISAVTDDTPEKWSDVGTGYAWYNPADKIIDKPSDYAILINLVHGADLTQFWIVQPLGRMYKRSGSVQSGWNGTWFKSYDEKNKPTPNELGVESLSGGTEIPANANLNTYKTVGNYHCTGDTTAQTLSNCPVTNAFRMKVGHPTGGSSYVYQEIFNWNKGTRFYRQCLASSDSWTEWIVTYDSHRKPTPAEIGAVATETILDATADLNNVVTSGMYRLGSTPANAPAGSDYGQLLVVHGGQDTIAQLLFPYRSTAMYVRTGFPANIGGRGQWGEWIKMANDSHTHALTDADITGVLPMEKGGTGATRKEYARMNLGLTHGYFTGNGGNLTFDTQAGTYSNIIFITGHSAKGYLTPWGGVMFLDKGATISVATYKVFGGNSGNDAKYENGILTINHSSDYLNVSGGQFFYYCV